MSALSNPLIILFGTLSNAQGLKHTLSNEKKRTKIILDKMNDRLVF